MVFPHLGSVVDKVFTAIFAQVLHAKADGLIIKILAAKMRVPSSGFHLEDFILNRDCAEGASRAQARRRKRKQRPWLDARTR